MQKFSFGKPGKSNITEWYNTPEGIAKSLVSLDDLNRLLYERHLAGYKRDENLSEFYVLGDLYLDSCGNCMMSDKNFKKRFPTIPDVLENESFWEFIKANTEAKEISHVAYSVASLPPAGIVCPVCKKPWTIEDYFDFVRYSSTEAEKVISLKDFVGKTLSEVKVDYYQRTDAVYRLNQPELIIRNDKFIDLTPNPDFAEHNKKYPKNKFVMNQHGWLGTEKGINDDYVVQEGDDGYFNIWRYYHKTCNRKTVNEAGRVQFERIFEKAGFKELDVHLLRAPNQYCSCGYCACWFNVNTIYGTGILIGWRKRVINIDWSQWGYDFSYLFPNEDVTKDESGIHAWGEEKAIEYLAKIATEVKNSKTIQNKIMTYRSTHEKDLYNN